jgi:hypothetical protein
MVKVGDKVVVDGIESTVETHWGQGNVRVFKLADGREVHNLDKMVANGVAHLAQSKSKAKPKKKEKPSRQWEWLPEDGKHDLEE